MRTNPKTPAECRGERVLIVAGGPVAALLSGELHRRGAQVAATGDIAEAALALREQMFDAIFVAGRQDANATALLLRMVRALAVGKPAILLLLDLDQAAACGAAMFGADEVIASSLGSKRLADAAGIGLGIRPYADLSM